MEPGKILIVDPEPIVVELIERRLRAAGFVTVGEGSASAALERASTFRPDVILLAMSLRDRDAFATIAELRKTPGLEGVSIALMATVQRDPASLGRGLDLGADDYLRKPIEPIELLARVRALLRLRRHIAELVHKTARLGELNAELERTATVDVLTGLYNRRYLERRMFEEIERGRRYRQALSVLVADVDHFKKVNDTYGHGVGDAVLRSVAATMRAAVRRVDLVARLGGEEFVIVTPSTDGPAARIVAERVRHAIELAPVMASAGSGAHITVAVTASFGIATALPTTSAPTSPEALIDLADGALYRAKTGGRNRVESAPALT